MKYIIKSSGGYYTGRHVYQWSYDRAAAQRFTDEVSPLYVLASLKSGGLSSAKIVRLVPKRLDYTEPAKALLNALREYNWTYMRWEDAGMSYKKTLEEVAKAVIDSYRSKS